MFNRLKSFNYYSEIASHFRLLSVNKKSFQEYISSPYRIILICVFTFLFLPHVFVVVRDINFVTAYEVDPGSIIQSILSLYHNSYNMNVAYHSKYYGWTYYSISYVLLMPIYLAKVLKIITNDYYFFVGLRFIFFMIGLSSVLAFFEVARRILKHTFLAFIAVLLYIASPTVFLYFYFIHPESTGLLFSFLGILCLLNFNDGKAENFRWYTLGLLALVLSTLSKHAFFVTALPVLFLFYYLYCHYHNLSIFKFAFSRQFATILALSALLSVLIFFIIDPFAFFQPKEFIKNQIFMFATQTQGSILQAQAVMQWLGIIKTIPVMYLSIILLPITLPGAMFLGGNQKVGRIFYIVNIIGSFLYIVIFSVSAQYIIRANYFAPVYPFLVLNLISIPLFLIRKWNVNIIKVLVMAPLGYLLLFVLIGDFSSTIPIGYTRLMYKDTLIYKTYTYIENNIPSGSKIAHDQFVALPSNVTGCHYWQGCGTDYIEEFQPDYIIFDADITFNGESLPEALRLKKYISDHRFVLVNTISVGDKSIGVWKKSDP